MVKNYAIDVRHINKTENGSIKKLQADTLETVLAGLQANYRNRLAVLEAFGYSMAMTLPTEQEIAEIVTISAAA